MYRITRKTRKRGINKNITLDGIIEKNSHLVESFVVSKAPNLSEESWRNYVKFNFKRFKEFCIEVEGSEALCM